MLPDTIMAKVYIRLTVQFIRRNYVVQCNII